MKKLTLIFSHAILAGIAALALLGNAGCETQSATEPVIITPSTASLKKGESAAFTAEGGFDYRWTLSSQELGRLSTLTGPTTVYTATAESTGTQRSQVLTCTSSILNSGDGGSLTNRSYQIVATATIVQP